MSEDERKLLVGVVCALGICPLCIWLAWQYVAVPVFGWQPIAFWQALLLRIAALSLQRDTVEVRE